jgi:hypothetical protein
LSVEAVGPDGRAAAAPAGAGIAIEIILDTSGSMRTPLRGTRRIDAAKQVLDDVVHNVLPSGAPVALRILGDRRDPCGTRLAVPLAPLEPDAISTLIRGIRVDQQADTALGAALRAVPGDLAGSTGTKILLLITDSEEIWPNRDLCGVDPAKAIRELRAAGIDARVNIVGLSVDDRRATRQLRRWANLGDGSYYSARDPETLFEAVGQAVSAPFEVYDAGGNRVAGGTVGGSSVSLPPGIYRVVVLTEPEFTFEAVVVDAGASVQLRLPVP